MLKIYNKLEVLNNNKFIAAKSLLAVFHSMYNNVKIISKNINYFTKDKIVFVTFTCI
jgi:hypothetical protein